MSGHLLLGEVPTLPFFHPSTLPPTHPSFPPPTPCSCRRRGSLGSLQLQVKLRDETVLPSHCYQPLVQLLCQEVKSGCQVRGPCPALLEHPPFPALLGSPCLGLSPYGASSLQDGQVHLVTLLDETTTAECRQEVAINLVKLFLGQGLIKEFLDLLFELELAKPCKAGVGSRAGGFFIISCKTSRAFCGDFLGVMVEAQPSHCGICLVNPSNSWAEVGGGAGGLRLGNPHNPHGNGQGSRAQPLGMTPMIALPRDDLWPSPRPWTLSCFAGEPNTLFRSNSLASKSMESFLKVPPHPNPALPRSSRPWAVPRGGTGWAGVLVPSPTGLGGWRKSIG